MKTILFVILSVLFLTSCVNNQTPKTQDQTLLTVNDFINSYNYTKVSEGEVDTISVVKIDSVVKIKNYPITNNTTDTSNIKIIGHTDIDLIVVTVKKQISGYYQKSTMVIGYVKNKKPFVPAFTTETHLINKLICEFKLNDVESIKLAKQKVIDNEKYMSE